jgi:hypothetical protein
MPCSARIAISMPPEGTSAHSIAASVYALATQVGASARCAREPLRAPGIRRRERLYGTADFE